MVVLIGVFWSNAAERPDGYSGGRADHRLPLIAGGSVIALALVALMSQWFGSTESDRGTSTADQGPAQDEWSIAIDAERAGHHVVFMFKTFSPLEEAEVQDLGGQLVWPDTEVALCAVEIQLAGDGFVQIGESFLTTEACGTETRMRRAFDHFGLPETACLFVRAHDVDNEYCAPLAVD